MCCVFFFFKQKTAYEMRISDWSSDVCSSDLRFAGVAIDITERKANEAALVAAKEERVFILQLAERQRIESDAGAITAIGAEALGRRLGADRAGFLRIVDGDQIAFRTGWSDGRLPPPEGRRQVDLPCTDSPRGQNGGATITFRASSAP